MESYLGRKIIREITFDKRNDDFGNYYDACKYLKDSGYSYGSMCGNRPIAIKKGEYDLPQKWKNFTTYGKSQIDGVMVGEFRNGVVNVFLFD